MSDNMDMPRRPEMRLTHQSMARLHWFRDTKKHVMSTYWCFPNQYANDGYRYVPWDALRRDIDILVSDFKTYFDVTACHVYAEDNEMVLEVERTMTSAEVEEMERENASDSAALEERERLLLAQLKAKYEP